jgi:lipopolysaccharide transport system ATP-binding protein
MSTVVSVENLGKKYLLSHQAQKQPYVALRDVIVEGASAISRRLLHQFRNSSLITHHTSREDFWALKDVSFEIKQGDRVGIIGRNGAGKSTLLKILSRIVEPTTGRVRIKGRVASLLEVGTGFHPELSGRENIFLNGAILGMSRAEIRKKFDEIVDFAEIEKFLDTPVKRYSSGMYVRLAFAVAAHLEPEILLVDEVLAVGDAQFQKKCLGKMEDVSTLEGRTLLFVSHNMDAISKLCPTSLFLDGGRVLIQGTSEAVISEHLNAARLEGGCTLYPERPDATLCFLSASVSQPGHSESGVVYADRPFQIELAYRVSHGLPNVQVVLHIYSYRGVHVFSSADIDAVGGLFYREPGYYTARLKVPGPLLGGGTYRLELACGVPDVELIDLQEGPSFEVRSVGTLFGTWSSGRRGTLLNLVIPWQTDRAFVGGGNVRHPL